MAAARGSRGLQAPRSTSKRKRLEPRIAEGWLLEIDGVAGSPEQREPCVRRQSLPAKIDVEAEFVRITDEAQDR